MNTNNLLELTSQVSTPFIVYDLDEIKNAITLVKSEFSYAQLFFSLKANSNKRIVSTINDTGVGFEIASIQEAKQLIGINVSPSKIMCLHPIKSAELIRYLKMHSINTLAVDSFEEVDKIKKLFKNADLLIRVSVSNSGSQWDLSGKFGIQIDEAYRLLKYIHTNGLNCTGITFHVGSQCESITTWESAIKSCAKLWNMAFEMNIRLKTFSLGGGLAIEYGGNVPSVAEVSKTIKRELKTNLTNQPENITIEPGRFIVANSGTIISEVFGLAERGGVNWAYTDVGTYNGLIETIEAPEVQLFTISSSSTSKNKKRYNIGGPTCVSLDRPFSQIVLPELKVGDRLLVNNAGAYTISTAAPFNGFPIPKEYFLHELKKEHTTGD